MPEARFTSFLVKVASRCNLDCDYCYVYHHADQSWRSMPRVMGQATQEAFASRLKDYCREQGLSRAAVIFHGGEPLLMGPDKIAAFATSLRFAVGSSVELDIGLQTNGILLNDEALDWLEEAQITVSLSLDGPRHVNDRHRTSRRGRTSFPQVEAALEGLKRRPETFAGIIAVIDAFVPPAEVFGYFAQHKPPKLDFLLPDSHHGRPPPGRATDPGLYERWLVQAFDLWFDEFPELPVRTFEAILDASAGLPTGTDAFGFGDVSLVTIETDGSYHDLDVLKVTADGATSLGGTVHDTPIGDIALRPSLLAHRRLLSREGVSLECQQCAIVEICGGGSVPHRFKNGSFAHPTVYCQEMKALVGHAQERLAGAFATVPSTPACATISLADFELAETARPIVDSLWRSAVEARLDRLEPIVAMMERRVSMDHLRKLAGQPGLNAWLEAYTAARKHRLIHDVDGNPLYASIGYLTDALEQPDCSLDIASGDEWLRLPFGNSIIFEPEGIAEEARPLVDQALEIIRRWRPALHAELLAISKAVQFVRDPEAHADKIVSFSDNSVPGALYVSVMQDGQLIDPYDLADSLIHEHRHQKLYLLERRHSLTRGEDPVVSPWREDLRPPSGLLHAVFVFVELHRFWEHVLSDGPAHLTRRATTQLADTRRNLSEAFTTLRSCPLTDAGRDLAQVLEGASLRSLVAA